jgi:hypothetical protein
MSNPDDHYTITGVALSNENILILCSFGFATLGIALFLILRNQPQKSNDDDHADRDLYGDELDQADVATLNRAQRRARAKYKMKQARRDMAPPVAVRGGEGDDNNMPADEGVPDIVDNSFVAIVADRKERQRIAKEMERNERKIYSMEAQRWRDKNQASSNSKKKIIDGSGFNASNTTASVEKTFPQRLDKNDPLSDILFWEAIVRSIKDTTASTDELISRCEAAQSKTMTIREFIERVNSDGPVSIIDLADEFEISIPDALIDISRWNELYNICGTVDSCGNFVYYPYATQ